MSATLINLNADLKALVDDGYEIVIDAGHLMVRNVPYVNSEKHVAYGTLICPLDLAGDNTTPPSTHIAMFSGDHPCDSEGNFLQHLKHTSNPQRITDTVTALHSFSSKPPSGYTNFRHKMTTYADMISRHAKKLDPTVTAQTGRVVMEGGADSVFKYEDTASGRAGINEMSNKLRGLRIDIIGLGGTGSYIFDCVCKTHVESIHTYDDDVMEQHNAFRSPGAATISELRQRLKKVTYYEKHYSHMRRNIVPHDVKLNSDNLHLLEGTDFVFICIDNGPAKLPIIEWLEANAIPFIDVGMGIEKRDDKLRGILRVTVSTPEMRTHVRDKGRISFTDLGANDEYSQNIQIPELNALNAVLAVIKWKKIFGFYSDDDHNHFTLYSIDGNYLVNEDES